MIIKLEGRKWEILLIGEFFLFVIVMVMGRIFVVGNFFGG